MYLVWDRKLVRVSRLVVDGRKYPLLPWKGNVAATRQFGKIQNAMMLKLFFFSLVLVVTLAIASACTETNSTDDPVQGTVEASTSQSIFHAAQIFTTESFLTAGWKKSKEYDTTTVPESTEIWYGFFDQKDIELRFYESHESALKHGVTRALESLKTDPGARIGGVNTVRTGYSAYAVVGNVVMLCELDLSSCETLINALEVP